MKLELKHLAGYLPYGLKAEMLNCKIDYVGVKYDEIVGLHQWDANGVYWSVLTEHGSKPNIDSVKPILRPLSGLTKEEFYHLWSHETDFESIIKFTESDIETIESYKFSLSFWNGIHENHFDIYGLIENNLAIDINTL